MCSVIDKQLLLTAYAYLFLMEQQKGRQGSEALSNLSCFGLGKSDAKAAELAKLEAELAKLAKMTKPQEVKIAALMAKIAEAELELLKKKAKALGIENVGSPSKDELEKLIDQVVVLRKELLDRWVDLDQLRKKHGDEGWANKMIDDHELEQLKMEAKGLGMKNVDNSNKVDLKRAIESVVALKVCDGNVQADGKTFCVGDVRDPYSAEEHCPLGFQSVTWGEASLSAKLTGIDKVGRAGQLASEPVYILKKTLCMNGNLLLPQDEMIDKLQQGAVKVSDLSMTTEVARLHRWQRLALCRKSTAEDKAKAQELEGLKQQWRKLSSGSGVPSGYPAEVETTLGTQIAFMQKSIDVKEVWEQQDRDTLFEGEVLDVVGTLTEETLTEAMADPERKTLLLKLLSLQKIKNFVAAGSPEKQLGDLRAWATCERVLGQAIIMTPGEFNAALAAAEALRQEFDNVMQIEDQTRRLEALAALKGKHPTKTQLLLQTWELAEVLASSTHYDSASNTKKKTKKDVWEDFSKRARNPEARQQFIDVERVWLQCFADASLTTAVRDVVNPNVSLSKKALTEAMAKLEKKGPLLKLLAEAQTKAELEDFLKLLRKQDLKGSSKSIAGLLRDRGDEALGVQAKQFRNQVVVLQNWESIDKSRQVGAVQKWLDNGVKGLKDAIPNEELNKAFLEAKKIIAQGDKLEKLRKAHPQAEVELLAKHSNWAGETTSRKISAIETYGKHDRLSEKYWAPEIVEGKIKLAEHLPTETRLTDAKFQGILAKWDPLVRARVALFHQGKQCSSEKDLRQLTAGELDLLHKLRVEQGWGFPSSSSREVPDPRWFFYEIISNWSESSRTQVRSLIGKGKWGSKEWIELGKLSEKELREKGKRLRAAYEADCKPNLVEIAFGMLDRYTGGPRPRF